jgi:hypothetical protein
MNLYALADDADNAAVAGNVQLLDKLFARRAQRRRS